MHSTLCLSPGVANDGNLEIGEERERVAGAEVHIGIKHFFFTDLLKHISKSGLKIRIKHFLHIFPTFQRKRFIVRFKCKIMYL